MSDKFYSASPRPWAATTRQGSWDWVIYLPDTPHIEVCQMFHDDTEFNEVGEANAALIVAAVNNYSPEKDEVIAAMTPMVEQFRKTAVFYARDHERKGDDEGYRLMMFTAKLCEDALSLASKIEGGGK